MAKCYYQRKQGEALWLPVFPPPSRRQHWCKSAVGFGRVGLSAITFSSFHLAELQVARAGGRGFELTLLEPAAVFSLVGLLDQTHCEGGLAQGKEAIDFCESALRLPWTDPVLPVYYRVSGVLVSYTTSAPAQISPKQ